LELANIRVGFEKKDLRPAIVCSDVNGLTIDHFKGQTAAGVSPARFQDVTDLVSTIHQKSSDSTPLHKPRRLLSPKTSR
jgi:hypothetical protein